MIMARRAIALAPFSSGPAEDVVSTFCGKVRGVLTEIVMTMSLENVEKEVKGPQKPVVRLIRRGVDIKCTELLPLRILLSSPRSESWRA